MPVKKLCVYVTEAEALLGRQRYQRQQMSAFALVIFSVTAKYSAALVVSHKRFTMATIKPVMYNNDKDNGQLTDSHDSE